MHLDEALDRLAQLGVETHMMRRKPWEAHRGQNGINRFEPIKSGEQWCCVRGIHFNLDDTKADDWEVIKVEK